MKAKVTYSALDCLLCMCVFFQQVCKSIIYFFFLNCEVICSSSAARSAGFAVSSLVLMQQHVWATILDLNTADVPALGGIAVSIGSQVSPILDLTVIGLLPSMRIAAHLEEVYLFHCGCHFVLLGSHVFRVLLVC